MLTKPARHVEALRRQLVDFDPFGKRTDNVVINVGLTPNAAGRWRPCKLAFVYSDLLGDWIYLGHH